jgi:segregation and condensation protein B
MTDQLSDKTDKDSFDSQPEVRLARDEAVQNPLEETCPTLQGEGNGRKDDLNYIRGVVEALLFVNEKPVALDQMKKVMETVTLGEIKKVIAIIEEEYEQRQSGMKIVEIAGGYQMLSNPHYAGYIRSFYKTKHKEKLSRPALETLAIIAYKQPVTRGDIEIIRGVNSDGVVAHLLGKELIKGVGRKEVPGRPFLYGTTKQFLEYFGLKSLEDMPRLEEFPALVPSPLQEGGASGGQELGEAALAVAEGSAGDKGDRPIQDKSEGVSQDAGRDLPAEQQTQSSENEP